MLATDQLKKAKAEKQTIKCVVWDLDNTIWDGILLEDSSVQVRPDVVETIEALDRWGILNSIASRNDHDTAMKKLEECDLADYFLYPEITWNSKSASLRAIARSLNIGLDTFLFVDDQAFEREEVAYELPEVICVDVADIATLLDRPDIKPRFITPESQIRRQIYQSDIARKQAEDQFVGASEEFLSTLGLVFRIKSAQQEDVQRAEELTVRTNQLNTTGYTYSYDELSAFCRSGKHMLLVSSLDDKYGTYGTIGLALVECGETVWVVKLLLMSCRVMSRGVGTIVMSYIMSRAKQAGARLQAEFIPHGRNRMMYVTYKFGGFTEVRQEGDLAILENDLSRIQPFPAYVQLHIDVE